MKDAQEIVRWLRQHLSAQAHLCLDSRQIEPGDAFFACPGQQSDGRQFINQAIANGAAAVVVHAGKALPAAVRQRLDNVSVPVKLVDDLPPLMGAVAHEWYERPSEAMTIIAVTGTNGKTSTVRWIAEAVNSQKPLCGTIGTLGVWTPQGEHLGGALTTPDVLTMHRSLAALRKAGASMVALEASSIGIDQGRLEGVQIDVAALTNLSHDHLDYHKSFDAYREAKHKLLNRPGLAARVLNVDDPMGRDLAAEYPDSLTYALEPGREAMFRAEDFHAASYGLTFNLLLDERQAQIVTHVLGRHNVANLLLVAGVLRQQGWSLGAIGRSLSALLPVAGRLQVVEPAAGTRRSVAVPLAVVDYAHTPEALRHTLETLREVATMRNGRLVCVFGCGGNRDKAKRPEMGKIASEVADRVIVTSDNPRDEEPVAIMQDIVAGIEEGEYVMTPDRARAIL